jgi:hypothetical protein
MKRPHGGVLARLAQGTLLAAWWLSLAGALPAQDRPVIVQSVDLAIPFPPAVVQTAGKPVVAYELHLTNFVAVDISLSRVQVLKEDGSGESIADYQGQDLRRALARPGLRRDHENPQVVGPGMRAVFYLWIELADTRGVPAALRHRVELDLLQPDGAVQSVAEGASSPVSRAAPVALGPPLRGGPWAAVYDPQLMGGHRTAIYTVDGRARIPGRFAVDWVRIPASGTLERDGWGRADWNGNGADVLAVADATVVAAMDDIPDNTNPPMPGAPPGTLANASGNYVALDLGQGRFAFYEHLQHGSVAVRTGARVRRGDPIARLGNSGSSSIGPHLHFHVADASATLAAEGLPFVFTRFEQLGAFTSLDGLHAGEKWVALADERERVRTLERPGANAVVQFR